MTIINSLLITKLQKKEKKWQTEKEKKKLNITRKNILNKIIQSTAENFNRDEFSFSFFVFFFSLLHTWQ